MKKFKLGVLVIACFAFLTACACSKGEFTVTFDSNGGSSVSSQNVSKGKTATKPKEPTREGYTFAGWYIDLDDEKSFDFSSEITKDITLIAKWAKGAKTYKLTLDTNGGEHIDPISLKSGEKQELPTPTKSGYVFLGWYNGEEKIEDTSKITSNMTLVAKWGTPTNTTPSNNSKPASATKENTSNTPTNTEKTEDQPSDTTPETDTPKEAEYTHTTGELPPTFMPGQVCLKILKDGVDVTTEVSQVYASDSLYEKNGTLNECFVINQNELSKISGSKVNHSGEWHKVK